MTTIRTKIGQSVSQIFQEFQLQRLLPSLTAGVIVGIIGILIEISLAALIFSGQLAGHVSRGIGFILVGTFVIRIVVALTSSFPAMIAVPQETPAAILALTATAIAGSLPAAATSENLFFTVMAAIVVASLLTGAIALVLGRFKLGGLIRFIPYPVVGGFLAGTGWLLVKGAMEVMLGTVFSFATLSAQFQFSVLIKWLPGVCFGILLLGVLRRYSHVLIIPAMLLAGIGVFYLVLLLTNTSFAAASGQGWLLGPFPQGGLWQPLTLASIHQVYWSVIFQHIGAIGVIVIMSVMSLLLNVGGIELAVRQDIDLNRELRSSGIANLIAGLGGSLVGYQVLSDSVLGYKLGANSRLVGLSSALVSGVTLCFGASVLSFFPKPVLGGLLCFLGLAFLVEWVYDAWFTLPKTDYALVLMILVVVGIVGFLQGVVVGIVAAAALFMINYSRINVIKHNLSGANYQSNVVRAVPYQRLLQAQGEQLLILKLQGFLFFGTAYNLFHQVRQRATDPHLPTLRFVVFDFRLVAGLDSSAVNSFVKLKQLAEAQKMTLVFTQLSPQILRQFVTGGCFQLPDPVVRIFPDSDAGVEWCEDQMLLAEEAALAETQKSVQEHYGDTFLESTFDDMLKALNQQDLFESIVSELMAYLERQEVVPGGYLIHQGDPPEALYFIESGQVTVQLERADGKMTRLLTLGFRTVVGELGFYLGQPASASVVVQQPGVMYRLSIEALRRMNETNPKVAALFHEFMAHLLGERLANTNNTLQALLD